MVTLHKQNQVGIQTSKRRMSPHAGHEEIIAKVSSLVKGNIRNRVLLYLAMNHHQTNTIASIAQGIRTTNGRVSQALVDLVSEGTVRSIRPSNGKMLFVLGSHSETIG